MPKNAVSLAHLTSPNRRRLLAGLSGAALGGLPFVSRAQADGFVAMTYPGVWEQAARSIIVPAFKKHSPLPVALSPVLVVDAMAKLAASRNNPPYDFILIDEPSSIQARAMDLIMPLPTASIPNLARVPQSLVGKDGYGVNVALQVFGIVYNPTTVKNKPTSWEDLWRPEYKGRVLISGPDTTIGMTWMAMLAKLHGGSEQDLEPAWKALARLKPNLATIPSSPGAVGTLFQQGQADIAVGFLSVEEPLRARGVDIAIAKPDTGWGVVSNIAQIVKGSKVASAAAAYIDTYLETDVQAKMAEAPYYSVPTNRDVPFTGVLAEVAPGIDDLAKSLNVNWAPIIPQRKAIIDRFNREFRNS
jgi:putative spermidine/putrescine transport system substrate-binding protein